MNMSFLARWFASTVTTLVIIYIAKGVFVTSLYEAFMSAVIIGLINASVPYLIGAFTFNKSIFSLVAFSLVVNSFIFFLMHKTHVGVQMGSMQAIILTAVMVSIFTWFITLSVDQKLIIK